MDKIIFTPWHIVRFKDDKYTPDKSEKRFLAEMNRKIKSDKYNVFYYEKDVSFTIVYNGKQYQVILPNEVTNSIRTGKYNELALQLLKLVEIKRKKIDIVEAKKIKEEKIKAKEERIKEIETSGYSKLIEIEDYKMYLDYLNTLSKTVNTESEKILINTKIRGVLKVLTNPYNLKLHFSRFICQVAEKGKELDEDKKEALEVILRKITEDYYTEIMNNGNQMLIIGSLEKPMNIIRRIEETEALLEEWLKDKKEEIEIEIPEVVVKNVGFGDELDELTEELHRMTGGVRR